MGVVVIDGNALADELHARLTIEIRGLAAAGVRPGLATLLVGEDYPAQAYERRVRRLAGELDASTSASSTTATWSWRKSSRRSAS